MTPSGPIQGAMVGSPQDIQCTVSTVDGVEFSSVMISWTGPGGDAITTDSRMTIGATTASGNDYSSTLQFAYLMEEDEGMYTCSMMILDATALQTVEIQSLTGKYTSLIFQTLVEDIYTLEKDYNSTVAAARNKNNSDWFF